MNLVSFNPQTIPTQNSPIETTPKPVAYGGKYTLSLGTEKKLEQPLQNHNLQKSLTEFSATIYKSPTIQTQTS